MHEFETTIEVPLTIKVRFSATKAEPMTRHYPGYPAGIDELQFQIVSEEIVRPMVQVWDGEMYRYKVREVLIDTGAHLHDIILDCMKWDEWQDLCLEHLEEIEQDREAARLDSLEARRDFLLDR